MSGDLADFTSIEQKTYLKLAHNGLPLRPVSERIRDFDEAVLTLDPEQAVYEASRCIHCSDPAPCSDACPSRNDISQALWLIAQGKFIEAAEVYDRTNTMPEICGRVCPHEQLCEGACVLSGPSSRSGEKKNGPVLAGALEVFASEYRRRAARKALSVPGPTGHQAAIIGAGPAGLSCAKELVQRGHWVTIFDAKPYPGGLLTYGIPSFKLPKSSVVNLWRDLEEAGVMFVGNTKIGRKKSVNDLFREGYEAMFIAVGVGVDEAMNIPGENLLGIYKATEFLVRANTDLDLLPENWRSRPEVGRKVVVIGGGDTASDCLRTALRMGADQVTCLYRRTENELPGRKHDRDLAVEEGARYEFLAQPIRFIPDLDGRLAMIECLRCELGEPDENGRRKPILMKGSNFLVEADTAILALGYAPDPIMGATTPGLNTHNWGLILADQETGTTSRFGIFSGGDVVTGPGLVVTAMVAGRKAAVTMDAYLY